MMSKRLSSSCNLTASDEIVNRKLSQIQTITTKRRQNTNTTYHTVRKLQLYSSTRNYISTRKICEEISMIQKRLSIWLLILRLFFRLQRLSSQYQLPSKGHQFLLLLLLRRMR
mmetsp:Transcript_20218/g.23244  ORF Transcript_20218/g.23244 Transcript_20218/m.23244 type:complete len:113 (+) Transcript_20218:38-376(+)